MQRSAKIIAVLASAILFTLCFPPHEIRPLAWVALVPFLYAVRRSPVREAVALAGLWGMSAAYGVTDWLPPTIALYYEQPLWLGFAIFLSAAALMGAADYMAFAAYYCWASHRGQRVIVVSTAAAWVAAELGRARLWSGNPWGLLGYSQVGLADGDGLLSGLIQVADVFGVYGISFVLISMNLALTEILIAVADRRGLRRQAQDLAICAVLLVAAVVYGERKLAALEADAGLAGTRVSVAQANLDLGSRWDPRFYGRNLKAYLMLTHEAVTASSPQIVFWPENAMTFFVDDEPGYRKVIAKVLTPTNVELVAGAPRVIDRGEPSYFNSAFLLSPEGDVTAHYDKQHLLPFTEYLPLERFDYIRRSFGKIRTFEPGTAAELLPTKAGKAGIVICNEAMFPRIVSERVRAGADYLVNLSNDSWINDTEFAEHQFNVVRLRAIENRRYLVRASTSGPSAVVDATGRVLVRTTPFSAGTIDARIRPSDHASFYTTYGDAFALVCLVWAALTIAASLPRIRRE